jgi:GntR family transcriptional regulator
LVEADIRRAVTDGAMPVGSRLPNEEDLAKDYGVSRSVVRQALHNLEIDGVVVRERAKGTFIAPPKLQVPFYQVCSFPEEMQAHSLDAESRVLQAEWRAASSEVCARLGLDPFSECFYLERLRLGGNEPLCYDVTWIHPAIAPFVENEDLSNASLFGLYEARIDGALYRVERQLRAQGARGVVARALGLESGAPVLVVDRTVTAEGGMTLDIQTRFYRGDRFSLKLDSSRS